MTATSTTTPTSTTNPTSTTTPTSTTNPTSTTTPPNNRVVHVWDNQATSWNFSTGWYGDYISQSRVNTMTNQGLMALTNTGTVANAWLSLLPGYSAGKGIAIKINFNNVGVIVMKSPTGLMLSQNPLTPWSVGCYKRVSRLRIFGSMMHAPHSQPFSQPDGKFEC